MKLQALQPFLPTQTLLLPRFSAVQVLSLPPEAEVTPQSTSPLTAGLQHGPLSVQGPSTHLLELALWT